MIFKWDYSDKVMLPLLYHISYDERPGALNDNVSVISYILKELGILITEFSSYPKCCARNFVYSGLVC